MDENEVREMIDSATLIRSRINSALAGDPDRRSLSVLRVARDALSTTIASLGSLPPSMPRGREDD